LLWSVAVAFSEPSSPSRSGWAVERRCTIVTASAFVSSLSARNLEAMGFRAFGELALYRFDPAG
jgi:hypothetical protein